MTIVHTLRSAILLFGLAALPVAAAPAPGDMTKAQSFGDWTLFTDGKSAHQFCFLTSEPKSSEPADTPREAPRAYISAWPKDGVKGELSFRLGFPAKKGSDLSASIGSSSFKMFASDDRAYVQDATQELKLVDAMKKGAKLSTTAITATGTTVTDTYSLSGLAQALQGLHDACL